MTRKRGFRLALACAAVAAVLCLAVWNSSRTRPAQVTRIAPMEGWRVSTGDLCPAGPYLWLTSHEVFHFTPGPPGNWDHANVLDMRTRQDQSVPGLVSLEGGHCVGASPDGQWILWNTQIYSSSPPGMAATRRSDGKTVRWPNLQTDRNEGFWLPDSRHWACITGVPTGKRISGRPISENRIVIYDVSHPGAKSFAIPGVSGMTNILGVTPQGKVIFDDTPDEWGGPAGQPQPPLSIREVSLDGPQPAARVFQVQVPKTPPGSGERVLLSPEGDRLLWTCSSVRPNSLFGWASSLMHRSFGGGTESLDIWTCPLNGNAPHHVGTWSGPQMGFAACWNPDGKHVSMTMNNELYSVSVP